MTTDSRRYLDPRVLDRIEGAQPRIDQREDAPVAVWLSARDRIGLELLGEAVGLRLGLQRIVADLLLPGAAGRLRARLHALGAVRAESHAEDGWHLQIDLAAADAARLAALPEGAPLRALLPGEATLLPVELPT